VRRRVLRVQSERIVGDLPRRAASPHVLRAHRRQASKDDESQGLLQKLDAIGTSTGHLS
jgi:hypothetical protein